MVAERLEPWRLEPCGWSHAAGAIHDWGTDELTIKQGTKRVTMSTATTSVPKADRPEEVFLAESNDLWKRLMDISIVPVATLDLKW